MEGPAILGWGYCCHENWPHLATCLLLGFTFFLRAQEVLSLHADDIEVSLPDQSVVIRLHRTKTSKQTLASPHHLWSPLLPSFFPIFSPLFLLPGCGRGLLLIFVGVSPLFAPFSIWNQLWLRALLASPRGCNSLLHCPPSPWFCDGAGRWKDQRTCRLYVDDGQGHAG